MQSDLRVQKESLERTYLIALDLPNSQSAGWKAEESLDELERLVDTAGGVVVGRQIQNRNRPDPATYIGSGKAQEIEQLRQDREFDMVVFNSQLSPVQQRNLEEIIGCRVLDRTTVILDIFALRARSRESRLQVELAQLNFLLPRLTGHGIDMSRLGGGIGTRGPGETKLEVDKRRIRERISTLRRELGEIKAHRDRLRAERGANTVPVVALTGYTNSGKSSLHRALSNSAVLAEDRLFATLEATTRKVAPADAEPYLLVDTVGFIHDLPTFLVAAFRSTLEEVAVADLLLHVVDASHLKRFEQMQTVIQVLTDLRANNRPMLVVYNKIDQITQGELEALLRQTPDSIGVSATHGLNLEALNQMINKALEARRERLEVLVPYSQSAWTAWAHDRGHVLFEEHRADGTFMRLELERGLAARLKAAIYRSSVN